MASKQAIFKDQDTPQYSLSSLFKEAPLGVMILEEGGEISYANEIAASILEFTPKELVRMSLEDLPWYILDEFGSELPSHDHPISATFTSRQALANLEICLAKDGCKKWVRVTTTPMLGPDGTLNKVLAYFKDITEEKKRHLKIEQNEENLREVLNLSDCGYIIISEKKDIVSFNKRAERLLRLSAELELEEGVNLLFLLPEKYKKHANEDIGIALKGMPKGREYLVKTSNNKEKWITVNYLPNTLKTDLSEQVVIEIKNITKNKELEHKLDDANEEMLHLMNNSLKSFFIVDEEYKIIQYNKHAENETKQYFGKKPKKNESLLPYISENYVAKFKENVHLAIEGKRTKEEEEREVAPGLFFYFEVEFFPSMNKRSKRHNVGYSSTNITEKKMTRQVLLKSVSELNKYKGAFYETCCVAVTDLAGKINDVNEKFCREFGYQRSEVLGKNIIEILDEKDEQLLSYISFATTTGKTFCYTLSHKTKTGTTMSLETYLHPVRDENGRAAELIFVS